MKNIMALLSSLFLFSLLLSLSPSLGAVQDFCIADYTSQETAAGFACKDPSKVTPYDFVYSGLAARTNTSNILKAGVSSAFYNQFPGVNGLGLSLARADLEPGGVISLHTHPRGSEILILLEGTLISGIITSENKVYLTTLKKGDVMVYPHDLLHFQYNSPKSNPATFFVGFNSDNPGIQFIPINLFGNDFPTELMHANTFIDPDEIKRLKAIFGGSA